MRSWSASDFRPRRIASRTSPSMGGVTASTGRSPSTWPSERVQSDTQSKMSLLSVP